MTTRSYLVGGANGKRLFFRARVDLDQRTQGASELIKIFASLDDAVSWCRWRMSKSGALKAATVEEVKSGGAIAVAWKFPESKSDPSFGSVA